jgi:hypothetical protein
MPRLRLQRVLRGGPRHNRCFIFVFVTSGLSGWSLPAALYP